VTSNFWLLISGGCLKSLQRRFHSGSDDGTVIVWHATLKTKMVLSSKNKSSVKCLAFSPNGKLLAAGRGDGHVDCWFSKVSI
jgi:WD40 repeat protein